MGSPTLRGHPPFLVTKTVVLGWVGVALSQRSQQPRVVKPKATPGNKRVLFRSREFVTDVEKKE